MSWRNRQPMANRYDSLEDYEEAIERFFDAMAEEADAAYEEERLSSVDA